MLNLVLTIQYIAIAFLIVNLFYTVFQRSSRIQVQLIILLISTIMMLTGYTVEIRANTVDAAMLGTAFAYMGKPFAMISSITFIAEVCDRRIPAAFTVVVSALSVVFPILIFTNKYHYLYYSSVSFDRSRAYSPLILGHAPLYFIYMAMILIFSLLSLMIIIAELKSCKDKTTRSVAIYLSGVVLSSALGYVLFLTGITGGYDTTMAGAFVGTMIITILFYRYRLFDYLTIAKEQALNDASSGLLVLNNRGRVSFRNAEIAKLFASGMKLEQLTSLEGDSSVLRHGDRVLEIKHRVAASKGLNFGEIYEVTDITDKYNHSAMLEKEVEERTSELVHLQHSAIVSFAGIVEARDNSTGEHIQRMSKYVELVAKQLQKSGKYPDILTDDYISELVEVAPLHDIGKLCIPDNILLKPGRLTPEEFEIIKTHSKHGARIIEECFGNVERESYIVLAKEIALYHHEKWGGGGYPENLTGEEIPLSARICSVADVYDAIRSERCYKPAMTVEEATKVITDGSGNHFDPTVVEAFLAVLSEVETFRK